MQINFIVFVYRIELYISEYVSKLDENDHIVKLQN